MIKKKLTLLPQHEQDEYIRNYALFSIPSINDELWLVKVAKDKYGNLWFRGRDSAGNLIWHNLDEKFENHKGFLDDKVELNE
jgi:hypothetical protein